MSKYDFVYMGVDPGTNTGIAFITATIDKILDIKTYNLDLSKVKGDNKILRYISLKNELRRLMHRYKPNGVAREEVFKGRFANAHAELTRLALSVDFAVHSYNPMVDLITYPPKLVKKYFTLDGTADKDSMRRNLSTHEELKYFYNENLTEHEVDAIAIAYLLLKYGDSIC